MTSDFCTSASLFTLENVDSTNSYVAANSDTLSHGDAVMALSQSAGRGQRGNSWESACGKNVTMSLLLRPSGVAPAEQFVISEAVALGVVSALREVIGDDCGACVKWPNDIYVGQQKICGILIENVITGSEISRSIVGVGLNVNQQRFVSDAPNPVSMWQLTGREYDIAAVAETLRRSVMRLYDRYVASGHYDELHELYMGALWRRSGYYAYRDMATGEVMQAEIADVASSGMLMLRLDNGDVRSYAFKEVAAVL